MGLCLPHLPRFIKKKKKEKKLAHVTPSKREEASRRGSQAQAEFHLQPRIHWTQEDTPPTLPEHTKNRCKERHYSQPRWQAGSCHSTHVMSKRLCLREPPAREIRPQHRGGRERSGGAKRTQLTATRSWPGTLRRNGIQSQVDRMGLLFCPVSPSTPNPDLFSPPL